MACPSCKHDRIRTIDGAEWYFSCNEENCYEDLIFKFCPYCGVQLTKQKAAKPIENVCLHCLESGNWPNEDVCPKCEQEGHTFPWGVNQCDQCDENYYDSINKIRNIFERHPADRYIKRKVLRILGQHGEVYLTPEFIQNEILKTGIKIHLDDIKAALFDLGATRS